MFNLQVIHNFNFFLSGDLHDSKKSKSVARSVPILKGKKNSPTLKKTPLHLKFPLCTKYTPV